MKPSFQLVEGCWQRHKQSLAAVRCQVFVVEQHVPESLELDAHDPHCHHVLVCDARGQPVGAGRIKADGHIGRMAVLQDCRGQGIGTAMLAALLAYASKHGHTRVCLHAQLSAVSFYARSGFVECGEPFMEAGIPHRRMLKSLP
ncbi:MAG: GNAT family N-acetyltransferase [Gammaproteobacteria bacterium]|jgi:predicted GNAT family N-acyltransferase